MDDNETEAQNWIKALLLLAAFCWFVYLLLSVAKFAIIWP